MKVKNQLLENIYFKTAYEYAKLSTCLRRKVGSILVLDGRIISSGTNGAPSHLQHCEKIGCFLDHEHCIRSIHSELNSLLFCVKRGIPTNGASLFCTDFPCHNCLKALMMAGITDIKFHRDYTDSYNKLLAYDSRKYIKFYKYNEKSEKYLQYLIKQMDAK